MMKALKKYMLFVLLLAIVACKKDKTDFQSDNRKVTDARKNSTVRLINLGGYNQLQLNGDSLTNYVVRAPNDPNGGLYPGTLYFPDNGRLGTTWYIPQSLLNNGTAKVLVETKIYNPLKNPLEFEVREELQQGTDYYLLPTETFRVTGQPPFVKIPRSVASPANPSNFKVRILNLAAKVLPDQGMEDLLGPMSLTWADGTAVSSKTSNILPGQYSEYIELPYGTAQLKVLTQNGIQISGGGPDVLDATSSTIFGTTLTYSPVKTYAPGGVYTIVVAAKEFEIPYRSGNPGETVKGYQNSFRIINDISEPLNLTYGRVQAVNAVPGTKGMKVLVNGKVLDAPMDYTAHTAYQSLIVGAYNVEAVDASGTVLATKAFQLDANTNFSFWVHPDANGKTTISAVANDLSGVFVGEAGDDASSSRFALEYPFGIRFLNLCPDVPYLTMTTNNAQAFSSLYGFNTVAVNNLRPGIPATVAPYIRPFFDAKPYQMMAFRSSPSVVPGTWASDIPVLTGRSLIARPELYVRGELPNHEPGFYTIALVGSTKASATDAGKAKMIIVKHNK
ncbi:DUF4397 domain-containing protein [Pedobacter sp. KBW06]|uniref:DUF4397 domain-containing protein n=1 Tax=Pedobacter sp. KBW06 TaxID=2153359 RepID=UPI000F5AEE8B|nr:DUF4397 domain-containing protein [Pedobacter sp. KBW06]RQO71694.1 DUF4397 domain-containing protein [Pedobacter sp. KBW06]